MRRVPFEFGTATVHWMDLYMGFRFAISVSGFVSAIMTWRLSSAPISEASLARTIAWLLCITQVAGVVLSLRYLGPIQAAFSVVSTACSSLECGPAGHDGPRNRRSGYPPKITTLQNTQART
jgi:hypothetical protein